MTDRAQLDSRGIHLIPLAGILILVLVLVVNQVLEAIPDPDSVETVCLGLCGCGACPPSFYALPVITALTILASYVVSFPKRVPDDEERDES